jgi:hypothetical protein
MHTAELELRFRGFEHARMGLGHLQVAIVHVERARAPWRLHQAFLARVGAEPCASGAAARLIDSSAGRTGGGEIVVAGPMRLAAGFSEVEAEDICEAACRLDILFQDPQREARCMTLQLTQ